MSSIQTRVSTFVSLAALSLVCSAWAQESPPPIWESAYGDELASLDNADEDERVAITLPFAFPFGGQTYTRAYVYVGGVITLGSDDELDCCPSPDDILEPDVPVIAPFWTNLGTEESGEIYYNALGDRVVISWIGVHSDENEDTDYFFQAQLHADGTIVFGYCEDMWVSDGSLGSDLITGISDGSGPGESERFFAGEIPFSTAASTIYEFWSEDEFNFLLQERNAVFIPNGVGYDVVDAFTRYDIAIEDGPVEAWAGGETFAVEIDGMATPMIDPASGVLHYDAGDGVRELPLVLEGGERYTTTLPAVPCGTPVEYWVTFKTRFGDTLRRPLGAPADAYRAVSIRDTVPVLYEADFEADEGWVSTLDSVQGVGGWTRTTGPGIVATDMAYVSEGPSPFATTVLTSPPIEAGEGSPYVVYERWVEYGYTSHLDEGEHYLEIEVSRDDGATWTRLEYLEAGPSLMGGGWAYKAFPLPGEPTGMPVRVRYTLQVGNPSTSILMAVDNVRVVDFDAAAADCPACPADQNGDGVLNNTDVNLFAGRFITQDPAADLNGDGFYNNADVNAFVVNFTGGC